MHIDKSINTDSRSVDKLRTAKVTKTEDDGPIGVPVFFAAEELEAQGIDLEDLDRIAVAVEDGVVILVPVTALADST